MKKTSITIVAALLVFFTSAQEVAFESDVDPEKEACECIAGIDLNETKEVQYEEVESCIQSAILAQQVLTKMSGALEKANDSTTTEKNINVNIDLNEGFDELEEKLIVNCKALVNILNHSKPSSTNSYSDDEKALEFYQAGYNAYEKGNFEEALTLYKKAVKQDKNFAFAWDMVGISHRRLGQFEEAVKAYKKSLKIDPLGKMPLQNLPIAYRYLEEYENAAEVYKELIAAYPEDPEGYYGLSQTASLLEDYSTAADNMMIAYKMYAAVNSPYIKDAEKGLSLIYNTLKEKDELQVFYDAAAKNELNVSGETEVKD